WVILGLVASRTRHSVLRPPKELALRRLNPWQHPRNRGFVQSSPPAVCLAYWSGRRWHVVHGRACPTAPEFRASRQRRFHSGANLLQRERFGDDAGDLVLEVGGTAEFVGKARHQHDA